MHPRDYLVTLRRRAGQGDEEAASLLLEIAILATGFIEAIYLENPALMKRLARFGAMYGFPVLRSWQRAHDVCTHVVAHGERCGHKRNAGQEISPEVFVFPASPRLA